MTVVRTQTEISYPGLFQPNDLSRAAVYREVIGDEAEWARSVLSNWIAPNTARMIDRLEHRDTDAAHFRVSGNERCLFLKGRRILPDGPSLEREVKIAAWLAGKDIKVPKPHRTPADAAVIANSGWAWALFDFVEGSGFTGADGELESAARELSRLTHIGRDWHEYYRHPTARDLFSDLDGLIAKAHAVDWVRRLVAAHSEPVRQSSARVLMRLAEIEGNITLTHVDFHPRNMIVANGHVQSILDFEDVKPYPLLAAVGFAAFKLIRQVAAHRRQPGLTKLFFVEQCDIWQKSWSMFPNTAIAKSDLADGARYIVLQLIHFILDAHIVKADDRYLDDLEKQLLSLSEIVEIFDE